METIRTNADWKDRSLSMSIFQKLDTAAQERFTSSLDFCAAGVCTFRVDDLKATLTVDEYAEFLASFGLDYNRGINVAALPAEIGERFDRNHPSIRNLSANFYDGAKCDGEHSCLKNTAYVCTSNCIAVA